MIGQLARLGGGKTLAFRCSYRFGLHSAVLLVLDGSGSLTYVDHVSKVVLEIFDEVVQAGGGLVKAPNKQSSFLCDNQRNRRWGKQKSGTTNANLQELLQVRDRSLIPRDKSSSQNSDTSPVNENKLVK